MANFTVSLKKLTEKVSMDVVYAPQDLENISVEIAEVNRPGLFLAGYYDYFDKLRLQIMGLAEMNFLSGLSPEKRYEALDQLFRQQPPAVIVGRSEELKPFPEMQELARKHGVALLRSNETTCTLMGSIISVLNLELAPRITRHGVLVEVYGEGILILGDSGIGKSELAIELVKRGHRLVADDAVELRKVSNRQIMGTAPENIRHFIELRGIGIVNVARVFGVGAVKVSESLDLVVQLEAWDPTKNYQRTGLESEYYEILGVNISTSIGLAGTQPRRCAGNGSHQQPPEEDGLQRRQGAAHPSGPRRHHRIRFSYEKERSVYGTIETTAAGRRHCLPGRRAAGSPLHL